MVPRVFALFLLLSMNSAEGAEQTKCLAFKKFASYNYVCPPDSRKRIEVEIKPSVSFKVICFEMKDMVNPVLPDQNFGATLIEVLMINCPIPQEGFKKLAQKFNITRFTDLKFIWKYSNESLKKEHFVGLDQLKELALYKNKLISMEADLFKHTPKLLNLILSENNFTAIPNDMFKQLNELLYLSIAENKIAKISRHAFRGLVQLIELDLANNKLKEIPVGIFNELVNLNVLRLDYNKLYTLGVHSFSTLGNLREITLEGNELLNISRKYFENNEQLVVVNLGWNANLVFEDNVLSFFSDLESVPLSNSGIRELPEDLFRGSTNVFNIDLQNNKIPSIPENLFRNMTFLKRLFLNNNEIKYLHPNQFEHLKRLEILDLSYNLITYLDEQLLKNLEGLYELHLGFNKLKGLPPYIFSNTSNLVDINLNNNILESVEDSLNGLEGSKNIKVLNLSDNLITEFPYKLMKILMQNTNKEYFEKYVSSHIIEPNTIEIYLGNNSISNVRFDYLRSDVEGPKSILEVNITQNPIFCDCKAADLVAYTHGLLRPRNIVLKFEILKCSGPSGLKNVNLKKLEEKSLICTLNNNCTSSRECGCFYKSTERTFIVDCSRKNLTVVPGLLLDNVMDLYDFVELKQIEVHLEQNLLKQISIEQRSYANVTKLFLQGNQIKSVLWIPKSLEVLNLENNVIGTLDNEVLNMLNKTDIKQLLLGYNPWECDCSTKVFQKFLREHISQIHNATNVLCFSMDSPLINLDEGLLCPTRKGFILVILSIILFCMTTIIISVLLYLIYQKEILIWLYSKDACMRFINEETIDKTKKYDAFVSFAQQDENFVMKELVPILEEGDPPYKLCIHVRDWIPGEYITKQIANSVKDSKRTLIVLSNYFLKSMWGTMEFRTAHTAAMEEGRVRVIIIIYGDLDRTVVSDDLNSYMRTNTYVEWGDPWFWEKLRDALPRRRRRKNPKRKRRDSKDEDIELH